MKNKQITMIGLLIITIVLSGCVETTFPEHNMGAEELDNPAYINYGDDLHDRICDACIEFEAHKPMRIKGEIDDADLVIRLWGELQENDVKSIIVLGDERNKQGSQWNECNDVWIIAMTPTGCIRINIVPHIIYSGGFYSIRTPAEIEECVSKRAQESLVNCDSVGNIVAAMVCADIRKECRFERHDVSKSISSTWLKNGFYYAKPSDLRADIGDRDITVTYINRR